VTAVDTWSAAQYLKFEDERTRPARDLLASVPLAAAAAVVDVGCGPGNSTELIASRFPAARITGVDTSADMLAAARRRLPAATFVEADIATWSPPAPVDLVFGNAVFQWVPDHFAVLARLTEKALAPGGVLAVQIPDNFSEPSHFLMREVAARMPFSAKLAGHDGREVIPSVDAYYDRLRPLSSRVDIWRTTYYHPLADADAIVEWLKGTGLRPYLDRLSADERPAFLAAYRSAIAGAYPPRADGRVLLPFPRLFIVAAKA
jgi:trans-aconitate 2-methyltransferase